MWRYKERIHDPSNPMKKIARQTASGEKSETVSIPSLFWAVFSLLTLFTLFPHLQTGYTTNDDVRTALLGAGGSYSLRDLFEYTKDQGRITNILRIYLGLLPYVFNSEIIYQLLRLGPLIANFVLFFILLKTYFQSSSYAYFATVLSWSFLQNNWEHNLITSYPFVHNFAFSCFLLSLLCYYRFGIEKKAGIWPFLSGIFFFLSMIIYEAFVLYALIYLGLVIYLARSDYSGKKRLKRTAQLLLPVVIPLVLFLFCYFLFQSFYPGHYSGVKIAQWSPGKTLRVIIQYSVGTFPGIFYFADSMSINATFDGFGIHQVGLSFFQYSRVEWIAKAVISALFCWLVLREKRAVLKGYGFLGALISGAFLTVTPFVLLGLTPKYQDWVSRGSLAYTTSFFSYFGTIIMISSIAFYINGIVRSRRIISRAYVFIVFCTIILFTMMTSYYNHYVTLDQQLSQIKWITVDRFINTAEFKNIPERSVIYAPSLWKARGIVALHPGYWTDYVSQKSGKSVYVVKTPADMPGCQDSETSRHVYFLGFQQEQKEKNQYLVFAELEQSTLLTAKKVTLFSFSKYLDFTIIGNLANEDERPEIFINGEEIRQDQIRGGVFFCRMKNHFNSGFLRKDDLRNRSFISLAELTIRRALWPGRQEVSRGFYRIEINSNAFIELENLTLSYYQSAMQFGGTEARP
ncbi:MAG TPA: hypothetical protein PLQ82_07145 [Desulfobacteraceae bacterium]|nr:hypothetical protein [Desulfobacteraceae bacterium]